mmetsp:Transcript_22921/g.65548  ORF Transcript_22921/g.65548 Transcript_22921/m.65548 type:complete len:255 (-) Transcript_22921:209-973(-)
MPGGGGGAPYGGIGGIGGIPPGANPPGAAIPPGGGGGCSFGCAGWPSAPMPDISDMNLAYSSSSAGGGGAAVPPMFPAPTKEAPSGTGGRKAPPSLDACESVACDAFSPASTLAMSRSGLSSRTVPLSTCNSWFASFLIRSPSSDVKSSSVSMRRRACSSRSLVGPRISTCGGSLSDSSRTWSPSRRVPLPRTAMVQLVSSCIRFCVLPRGPMISPTSLSAPPGMWSGKMSLTDMRSPGPKSARGYFWVHQRRT